MTGIGNGYVPVMMLARVLGPLCAMSLVVAACGDDDVESNVPPIDELDTPEDQTDAGVDDQAAADLGSSEGVCGWLTPDDIGDNTGHRVQAASGDDGACTWDLSDEAAVTDGPNEGEDAVLRLETIDEQTFRSDRSRGSDLEDLPADVGDMAHVLQDDEFTTTLYVADGSTFFTLSLVAALDDGNARLDALVELGQLVVDRT